MENKVIPELKGKELVKHKVHEGIHELNNQLNHVFESFMKGFGSFGHGDVRKMEFSPDFDIVENEDAYEVKAELSGMDEDDVNITLSNNTLSISGEKKEESSSTEGNYHISERKFGQFRRNFTLPEGIDESKIKALFKKGVLYVRLPKKEETKAKAKAKKISITKE